DDEDRRQRAAGRARREGDPPDDELAHGEGGERGDGQPPGRGAADHVVADAESAGDEQPERRPHQRADDGVPRLADREPAEYAFDDEQTPGEEDGGEAA